jgi:hypothetical protein
MTVALCLFWGRISGAFSVPENCCENLRNF